mgnify:CR=1 FL=1
MCLGGEIITSKLLIVGDGDLAEECRETAEDLIEAKKFSEQGRKLEVQNALSDLKIRSNGFVSITQMAIEIITSYSAVGNDLSNEELKEVSELLLNEICTNVMTLNQQLRTAELLKKLNL